MHLKNSKIIVIKIGSALLVDSNKKIRNNKLKKRLESGRFLAQMTHQSQSSQQQEVQVLSQHFESA